MGDPGQSNALFHYKEVIFKYITSLSNFQFVRLNDVSDMFTCNVVWLPKINQSEDMFVSLVDVKIAIVGTNVLVWTWKLSLWKLEGIPEAWGVVIRESVEIQIWSWPLGGTWFIYW